MPSIFKHNQRKRQSVDGDVDTTADSVTVFIYLNDYLKIGLEYEQSSNQIVGNTAFVSRRLSPPCRTDQVLPPILDFAKKGDLQSVKDILTETPDYLYCTDKHGYTALFYAVYSKKASICNSIILT